MTSLYYVALVVVVGLLLLAVVRASGAARRQRSIRDFLDRADELERQLHDCKRKLADLRGMALHLPEGLAPPGLAELDSDASVQDALRQVLAHRLWLARNSGTATRSEIDRARNAMQRSSETMDVQLRRLASAIGELREATSELKEAASQARTIAQKTPAALPTRVININGHVHTKH